MSQPQSYYTVNQLAVPCEGPRAIPFTADFSVQTQYTLNLQNFMATGNISLIQSVFIDNSANAASVSVQTLPGGQSLIVGPNTQAYLMLLAANPPQITVSSTGGVKVNFFFNNFPVANAVWKSV